MIESSIRDYETAAQMRALVPRLCVIEGGDAALNTRHHHFVRSIPNTIAFASIKPLGKPVRGRVVNLRYSKRYPLSSSPVLSDL